MKALSNWLRSYLPALSATDHELAEALTLRGIAVEGVFDLGPGNGSLFEMDITTNRVDAMNHYGIAREAAAIYGVALASLASIESIASIDTALPSAVAAASPVKDTIKVAIEAPELCGRFTARALSGVRIQPSSGAVAERFKLLEQKLISNVVDAMNYVTMAIGHPTHAFDRDKLAGGIIVRRARKGEKLRMLDGIERVLDPEDLVVADEVKAVALAGVMGGWDTMITADTRNVVVEAAWFDPLAVRRSSKRHGLHTEASHRFERGADFAAPPIASALVSRLLLEAGGSVEGDLVDVVIPEAFARTVGRSSISLSHSEVCRILGATEDGRGVPLSQCESMLTALGCNLKKEREGVYSVGLPSWRLDLEREIDLIEEIARVYGYNRFANTLPAFTGAAAEPEDLSKEAAVRSRLLASGWSEAISSTFCSGADADRFAPEPGQAVPLGNPLSEEAGILRPSLAPGMLAMVGNNLNRDVNDVQLFEIGTVFSGTIEKVPDGVIDRVVEHPALALGASGSSFDGLGGSPHALGFYDLKGAVEQVLECFALRSIYFDAFPADREMTPPWLHPYRAARAVADGLTVAWFGQLHPAEAQRRKLRQEVYAGEVYLHLLYRSPLRQPIARELSRFQPVRRDFSFVFPDSVAWRQIANSLDGLNLAELTRYLPREILRDSKGKGSIPAGHYSILINVTFQSLDRTLRDDELKSYWSAVIAALQSLGGKLRS